MSKQRIVSRLSAIGCLVALGAGASGALAQEQPANGCGKVSLALPPESAPLETDQKAKPESAPVVIDNDEAKTQPEYQWKEIPDADGKTHIEAGARFPVTVQSPVTSANAKLNDSVEGRLKVSIKIGGRQVAQEGDRVLGHVILVEKARKLLRAEFTPNKRWMHMGGTLGIQFDEIITQSGDHIPLVAAPARNPRIVKNDAEGRVMGVNTRGQISSPMSGQLKSQALHMAIRAAAAAGGVFSMGAVPVAYGCIGAISPSFAFEQPVGKNMRHRRLKGFSMGVLEGLPGGFLISDSIIKGPEARIEPGDVFLAEFKEDFTGEPALQADLQPDAKASVHGQILPRLE